ncbi:FkbM family methyltransferase [Leptospira kanakyensis]|uniref:FkbM family methyltransferase n=1 Tax=Leptospira kanakyensis TaxID=2484968 RepID=UPI00223D5AB3|nr:FkbM family methyltransferase [Leptospira kanakyensis]MCW7482128.1 FkbM family methyltransferase [Leptospira kanakyensis]
MKSLIELIIVISLRSSIIKKIIDLIISHVMSRNIVKVIHSGIELKFHNPNAMINSRIETFSTKEPETLEWIDTFDRNSTFWDVGANVGLYSIYACKRCGCRVIAFEPSVFNLELLSRNIFTNKLTRNITVFPIPLSDSVKLSNMIHSMTDWGGSQSTFDKDYRYDGKTMDVDFEYPTLGVDGDFAVSNLGLPQPDYIKIDVDGIEHVVLTGMTKILTKSRSILVEINDDFVFQREASEKLLLNLGFKLKEKRHSEMFDNTIMSNVYNQIWVNEKL